MDQCLSAVFLIESFGSLNENSACFYVVLHWIVVCLITFDYFCFSCDHSKPKSNHSYVCEVCQHITHISRLTYCMNCLIWKVIGFSLEWRNVTQWNNMADQYEKFKSVNILIEIHYEAHIYVEITSQVPIFIIKYMSLC